MQADPQDKDTFPHLEGTRRIAAQMMRSMDRACGQVIDKVNELGLAENTIIVFTNDNGGPMDRNGSSNYPFAGVKATQLEGGLRVPALIAWPGVLPGGETFDHPAITLDLLPTFIEAGGGDASKIENLDGVNLLPHLKGKTTDRPHERLYWKMETRGAIREGDWKLLRYPDRPAELFHLPTDPGEQNNRAAEHPEKVAQMFRELFAWEMTLDRPAFLLQRFTEDWSAKRTDEFRQPPAASY